MAGRRIPRMMLATLMVAAVAAVAPARMAVAAPVRLAPSAQAGVSTPATTASPAGTVTVVDRGIHRPAGIAAGPDGALWFTNPMGDSVGRITTAGAVTMFGGVGILAPTGIAAGPDGALWFTNSSNSIGRITTTGAITDFSDASIHDPMGIAAGPDGALWFTNRSGQSIGRITTAGVVTGYTGAGTPEGITAGPDGAMWFTDDANQAIGRITTAGTITEFTGPLIGNPQGITSGPDGNLWFTEGNVIGRITTAGVVTNFSGVNQPQGITSGPDGNLWFAEAGNAIGQVTTAGVITNFHDGSLSQPLGIAAGADGNLWFTNNGPGSTIGKITAAGAISNFSGSGMRQPDSIVTGPDGNLWFTNYGAGQGSIGRTTPAGVTTAFTDPALESPTDITVGPDGALWFTDLLAKLIGRITTAGVITTFSDPSIMFPEAIASSGGYLWFTNEGSVGRMTTAGAVTDFTATGVSAGNGITASPDGDLWFTNDGLGGPHNWGSVGRITSTGIITLFYSPGIDNPNRITLGPDGNLWFTNAGSDSIGRIMPTGDVTIFQSSGIDRPFAIGAGPDGNLWFTNASFTGLEPAPIGRITTGGLVTVFSADGIQDPQGITAGPDGSMWFTDSDLWSVGKVSTTADGFHPVAPTRVLDSRPGPDNVGGYDTPWGNSSRDVQVAGVAGVPADADAVVLNVTVTDASAASYLQVFPAGLSAVPLNSNLNFTAGETIANQVTVQLGRDSGDQGKITIFNSSGSVDVIADVTGYYQSASGDGYTSLSPTRLVDSRPGSGNVGPFATPWGAGVSRDVAIAGHAGVPADADAVVLNGTATGGSTGSYLSVWPQGSSRPTVSSLNWVAGQTIPNAVTVELNPANGKVSIYNYTGSVDVVVDVSGYFEPGTGKLFHPMGPARILDSRAATNTGPYSTPWGPNTSRTVTVAGADGVQTGADSVVANVTVTGGDAGSYLTLWPTGASRPTASNLNWVAGQTIPNAVTVKLSGGGQISIYNLAGDVDVVVDVSGWYG